VDTSPGLTGEMVVNAVIKLLAGGTAPKNVRVPVAKITKDSLPQMTTPQGSYEPVRYFPDQVPIGIHPGSTYRQSLTSLGWPTFYLEDYTAYAQAFQSQLGSLICEGAFAKFPGLKVVLIESGVTWLPGFMWRLSKFWRGVRAEVPWVDRSPADIVRDHVRLTITPFDAPDDPDVVERVIDQLRSDDILLYASDFPHWQFDGEDAMPPGLPAGLQRKILVENPLATYPRLKEAVS